MRDLIREELMKVYGDAVDDPLLSALIDIMTERLTQHREKKV